MLPPPPQPRGVQRCNTLHRVARRRACCIDRKYCCSSISPTISHSHAHASSMHTLMSVAAAANRMRGSRAQRALGHTSVDSFCCTICCTMLHAPALGRHGTQLLHLSLHGACSMVHCCMLHAVRRMIARNPAWAWCRHAGCVASRSRTHAVCAMRDRMHVSMQKLLLPSAVRRRSASLHVPAPSCTAEYTTTRTCASVSETLR